MTTPDSAALVASQRVSESASVAPIRVGSLCSGYGGLDMGIQLVYPQAQVVWHVEYDPQPSKILAHHWPDVPNHGDVKHTDWTQVAPIDLLTAGYPCQPFSHAGLRKGADDPRHLWPGVARAISVLRPRLAVLENVRGHVSLGLDAVLGDLAELGYDATWGVVRASDAGAPHSRARIFILAADATVGRREGLHDERQGQPDDCGCGGAAADADQSGPQGGESAQGCELPAWCADADPTAWGTYATAIARWERTTGSVAPRPTEPGRTGERLSPRFVEWMMGLPAGHVTDVPGLVRNAQLKALGNGVVPQQAALAVRTLLPLAVAA